MIQSTKLDKEASAVFPKCPVPTEFRSCCTEHVTSRLDFLGPQIAAAAPTHSDTNISDPECPIPARGWYHQYSPVTPHHPDTGGSAVWSRHPRKASWQEHPHWSSWIGSRYVCLCCFHSMKKNEACSFKLKTEEI